MFTSKITQTTIDEYLEFFANYDEDESCPTMYIDEGQEDRYNPEIPPAHADRLREQAERFEHDEISREEFVSLAKAILETEI